MSVVTVRSHPVGEPEDWFALYPPHTPGLAIARKPDKVVSDRRFTLTHVASGYGVGFYFDAEQALLAAEALVPLADWTVGVDELPNTPEWRQAVVGVVERVGGSW